MSMYQVPYGSAGLVQLQGNASQIVQLDNTSPIDVMWSPVDRRSMDVEVRVYIQQMRGLSEQSISLGCPDLRWGMRTAHGTSVIDEPAIGFPLQPGTFEAFGEEMPRTALPMMPGRGLHFRVTTRELTLRLQNTGYGGSGYKWRDFFGGPTYEEAGNTYPTFPPVSVAVSFQPCEGLEVPVLPRSVYIDAATQAEWGNYTQIPAAAREWRVVDDTGREFQQPSDEDWNADDLGSQRHAVTAIMFRDAIGYQVAEFLPWEIDEDWQVIPLDAWAVHRQPPNPTFPDVTAPPIIIEFR